MIAVTCPLMTTLTTKHQRLAALRPLSPESVASLAAAWDVRMVYESNSIEGNTLTLRETELVLSKGVTVSGKPLKDHLEAVNLALAWDRVKEPRPARLLTHRARSSRSSSDRPHPRRGQTTPVPTAQAPSASPAQITFRRTRSKFRIS